MLRRVALVRTDVSEELSSFIIRVTRICELGTALAVSCNRRTLRRKYLVGCKFAANVVIISPIHVTLMMEALSSSETSVRTTATGSISVSSCQSCRCQLASWPRDVHYIHTNCTVHTCSIVGFAGHFVYRLRHCTVNSYSFSTLPDCLSSCGSGTGSTHRLKDKWGATWKEK
jgi:hypothetical protein